MVESDAHERARVGRGRDDRVDLARAPSRRLLDQDVLAGRHRRERDLGELVVRRGDDHHVDLGPLDDPPPLGQRLDGSGRRARQGLGPLLQHIGTDDELGIAERPRALLSHEPAADDADLHLSPMLSPRHPTLRLSPTPCHDPMARSAGACRDPNPRGLPCAPATSPMGPTLR